MKPAGWPRYMREKRLKGAGRGLLLGGAKHLHEDVASRSGPSRLGPTTARPSSAPLNSIGISTAWREGRGASKELDLQPGFGTLGWLVERYKRSPAWAKVSDRSRYEYERAFRLVLDYKLTTGQELRLAPVQAISARGVDKLYVALQKSDRVGRRLRQANLCMIRMARAWDAVHRLYPQVSGRREPVSRR